MDASLSLGLRGRRALVTGGSRGVGRATALMLASAGADVGIGYRTRAAEADAVVGELRALGVRSFAHAAELGEPEGAPSLFRAAERELGGVDLFVANAGIWIDQEVALGAMEDAQWRRTMAANLDAVFYSLREAARSVADGGRIVLVSSTAGQRGEAGHADYAATKGALISITKSLAVELAPRDVNVNCVAPGWIDTEMVARPMSEGREAIEAAIPLRRIASAEDVAGPIVFLCSTLSRHITGEIVNVNGGSVLCG